MREHLLKLWNHVLIKSWLGIKNLFQTFEDLDNVENVQADILAIRNLLDENEKANGEEHAC
jgi:hypothetical protein